MLKLCLALGGRHDDDRILALSLMYLHAALATEHLNTDKGHEHGRSCATALGKFHQENEAKQQAEADCSFRFQF